MKKTRGVVAMIGRPNVGKSTLFNILTQERNALVHDQPGVTRDRIYGKVAYDDRDDLYFWLVDTGGFETLRTSAQVYKESMIWRQTSVAIDEADLVLLVVDAQAGLHPHDEELINYLRSRQKKYLVVVNKIDDPRHHADRLVDFYALGVEELFSVSAAHARGIPELREEIINRFSAMPHLSASEFADEQTALALVGRPNVGKSSLLNRLSGSSRALVSPVAGTTRDTVDAVIQYANHSYRIVDTAGIRRQSRINEKIESLSVLKSIRAIEAADIVVLVVDAVQGFSDQEARLASMALDQHKALIIFVNKWDLISDKESNSVRDWTEAIHARIKTASYVPVLFASCLENQRIFKLLAAVDKLRQAYERRVSTADLNRALTSIVAEHTPALVRNYSKRVKFFFATQVQSKPPTIVIKCNVADEIQESYKRYMMHRFRDLLGFEASPLRLIFRGKAKHAERGDISLRN